MMMVHNFNPSPKDDYEVRGNSSQTHSLILRFQKAGVPFQTAVEVRASGWLFCSLDLQVESQFLTLSFINCSSFRGASVMHVMCVCHVCMCLYVSMKLTLEPSSVITYFI